MSRQRRGQSGNTEFGTVLECLRGSRASRPRHDRVTGLTNLLISSLTVLISLSMSCHSVTDVVSRHDIRAGRSSAAGSSFLEKRRLWTLFIRRDVRRCRRKAARLTLQRNSHQHAGSLETRQMRWTPHRKFRRYGINIRHLLKSSSLRIEPRSHGERIYTLLISLSIYRVAVY